MGFIFTLWAVLLTVRYLVAESIANLNDHFYKSGQLERVDNDRTELA